MSSVFCLFRAAAPDSVWPEDMLTMSGKFVENIGMIKVPLLSSCKQV
jgi:hypothetical protein